MSICSRIDILLSTFNGAEYLSEQLASIVAQDINDWQLIIRDDCSVDNSVSIINEFALNHPERVVIITRPSTRLGVVASFEYLLAKSSSQYIAFCDQDDVWLPDKLRRLKKCMQYLEDCNEAEIPLLVHSDLHVVNKNLEKVADSFWKYQKLNPVRMQTMERLLVQNCVTGCATIVNRKLVECALPIPEDAIMHDWWFALIAVSNGKIKQVDTQTVQYRQHAKNDTGAKRWSVRYVFEGMFRNSGLYKNSILNTRNQAKALLMSGRLDNDHKKIVSQYVELFDCGWFRRRLTVIRMGFYKYGFIRNIALMIWL